MVDEEHLVGGLLDRARDALAVLGPEHERAKNQEVECTLQQRELLMGIRASGFHLTQAYALLGLCVNPSVGDWDSGLGIGVNRCYATKNS